MTNKSDFILVYMCIVFFITNLVMICIMTFNKLRELKKKDDIIKQLKEENDKLKDSLSKASGLPMKTSFKNDIEFLDYMIGFKVENVKIYRLKPLQLAQTTIIGDKEFATWTEETVIEVCNTLSVPHKRMLNAYFTDESLIEYITEQVTAKLTSEILSANFIIRR